MEIYLSSPAVASLQTVTFVVTRLACDGIVISTDQICADCF